MLPLRLKTSVSAMQREEPVAAVGRTRGKRHQADVRFGPRRRTERQLYEVKLTPDCYWAVSLLRRLLPRRANWRYRPVGAGRQAAWIARKQPFTPSRTSPIGRRR